MNLNHLDLPVVSTPETQSFFQRHFGFRPIFSRDDGLVVLLGEDDFALTLSPLPGGVSAAYPPGFHVGFNLESEAAVLQLHDSLSRAGVLIVRPLGDLAGALTFHCHAPGGLLVEVAWRSRD